MKNRLLILNLYYAPESFGGATIVAEQTALRLQEKHNWSVLVVTTMRDHSLPNYFLKRYKINGMNVLAINMPIESNNEDLYRNSEVARCVMEIARVFQPDVCHCHAIQSIGCGYFDGLIENGVKVAITIHDCWWICEQQFMINSDGFYCNQWVIDDDQCRQCSPDFRQLLKRNAYLRDQLDKAELILFPSEFQRDLYLANGISAEKSVVNKNGVTLPDSNYPTIRAELQSERKQTVFGFVGGPGFIKGSDQIVQAFNEIERTDYTLEVVDAAGNLGASWKDKGYWSIPGKVEFIPPYRQEVMDKFFAGIDVLLFPSQWKESFGLTVREALARDVWVIATDAGGVAEDIEEGRNSNVIPFGSGVSKLRQAIEHALDPNHWENYKNPLADKIRGFDAQAQELSEYLHALL